MKNLLIVGNWKSNLTSIEALQFLKKFELENLATFNAKIIICPQYLCLAFMFAYISEKKLPIFLGAQDVSSFPGGPHTGEVTAQQVAEFATYTIIGHSERRRELGETDTVLVQKALMAKSAGLTPIFCVQGEDTPIPENVETVAYEPVEAIGTGHPDTPDNAERVAHIIKTKNKNVTDVLYGGSVTWDNVKNFIEKESISGVLVGGASLDPAAFASIFKQC